MKAFSSRIGQSITRKLIAGIATICLFIGLLSPAALFAQSAERPKTEDLLPETTVLYVQIENIRDFIDKMGSSNMGRMLADERVAPLASEIYNQALDAYNDVEETVGLSIEELQSLPSGEICFAVVAPKRQDPAVILIADLDPENVAVDKALNRGREFAESQGVTVETEETEDGIQVEKLRGSDGQDLFTFRKDGTLVAGNNEEVINEVIERWMQRPVEKIRPLSENRKFVTIMNRCRGTKESPPEARFFVDPINFAKSALRGNFTAAAALNFFPTLGLDGLLGAGGAILMNEQEFESVFHGHLLLSNPRKGIFEMVSLKPDEYRPQAWVPRDVTNYMTTSWDVPTMFAELEKIVDAFTTEGNFQEQIQENINDEIGIDLEEDVINNLAGRITYVQWIQRPARINSTTNILGIQVNDREKAQELIDLVVNKIEEENGEEALAEKDYNGVAYWTQSDEQIQSQQDRIRERLQERAEEQGRSVTVETRTQQPCIALLEDHIIVCDSVDALKQIVDTEKGEKLGLADDEEFDKISRKMTRLLGTDMPSALFFSRPSEQIRLLFDLAQDQNSKEFLDEIGAENKYVKGLKRAMDENPLPNFDDIKHYFPAQGSFVTDDDTGYHILTFQMRAPDRPETEKNN